MIRSFFKALPVLAAVQLLAAVSAFGAGTAPDAQSPFVICEKQRYALCAEASCFVFDGVAYCKCDVNHGDSISLQLSYTTPAGTTQNVCDVNEQGKSNGYMVSTYSFPANAKKGGTEAAYTCPGTDNAGSGVPAPVAYGQCDGGLCFASTRGKKFPGFAGRLKKDEIMCSCPVSTEATAGSTDSLGYQIFAPYHPNAPIGSRCDASSCSACSVPNPTGNGAGIHVGAPTGSGSALTVLLDGPPPPDLNECLCTCTSTNGVTTCSSVQDMTQ
jgi:hypothetical protein